jgi:hypothetical protein
MASHGKDLGLGFYSLRPDGSGAIYSASGKVVVRYKSVARQDGGEFTVQADGSDPISIQYAVSRDEAGVTTAEGLKNGQPFTVRVSADGTVLESTVPALSGNLATTLDAFGLDVLEQETAHGKLKCAFLGTAAGVFFVSSAIPLAIAMTALAAVEC